MECAKRGKWVYQVSIELMGRKLKFLEKFSRNQLYCKNVLPKPTAQLFDSIQCNVFFLYFLK